jgi:voltage-gated potassium channel
LPEGDAPAAERTWVHIFVTAIRAALTASVLVTLYYLLPLNDLSGTSAVAGLVVGILVFLALIAWQIWTILQSAHPATRAIESLVVAVPLFILLFATAYYLMGRADPSVFSEALTRSDAVYFAVTIFATVGFGDISAQGETARLVVTAQMILDLIILGAGIRIILSAVQRSRERAAGPPKDEASPT